MKLAESLFGARIQIWIVCRETPSSAAISAIGRPLVSVRSIIARRSCSVCRRLRIFESPPIRKTQAYEAHHSGARTPGSGRLRYKRAKQHAPVRVVFHLPFHEGLFGETREELLMVEGKVAPLQGKAA